MKKYFWRRYNDRKWDSLDYVRSFSCETDKTHQNFRKKITHWKWKIRVLSFHMTIINFTSRKRWECKLAKKWQKSKTLSHSIMVQKCVQVMAWNLTAVCTIHDFEHSYFYAQLNLIITPMENRKRLYHLTVYKLTTDLTKGNTWRTFNFTIVTKSADDVVHFAGGPAFRAVNENVQVTCLISTGCSLWLDM